MKKLLVAAFSFSWVLVCSQSLQAFDPANNNITGQTIDLWNDVNNQALDIDITIRMVAGGPERIMAQRHVMSAVPGTDNLFCWVVCYGANTNVSPAPLVMNTGDQHFLSSHYFNYGIAGTTVIRYALYDSLNISDSIAFTIRWHVTPLGMNTEVGDDLIGTIFPDPASDHVKLRLNAWMMDGPIELHVNDLSGRVVLAKKMEQQETELDVSELTNGTYFIHVGSDRVCRGVKKLVVLH